MKKKYEIPEAEAICTELEMGLLTVTGGQDPFEEEVIPDDSYED